MFTIRPLEEKSVLTPGLESRLTHKLELEHQSMKGGGSELWDSPGGELCCKTTQQASAALRLSIPHTNRTLTTTSMHKVNTLSTCYLPSSLVERAVSKTDHGMSVEWERDKGQHHRRRVRAGATSSTRLGGSRARARRFLQWDFIPRAPRTLKPSGRWRDLL